MYSERVLSGMRPTGSLHLGHYHGALKNWVKLQGEHECFFFVADWHALTTSYDDPSIIAKSTWDMVIDWLAAGVDPAQATLFIQSRVPEHAELHLLLSMITPLSWLERVPTYKDQQEKLAEKDLSTYGFLGYPLLQSAEVSVDLIDGARRSVCRFESDSYSAVSHRSCSTRRGRSSSSTARLAANAALRLRSTASTLSACTARIQRP